ncbi:MAG: hypothetical protein CLLPBCKN_000436 [Chroococcidiopsis cubana SAG 39.79]|uniref:Peptidase A2 domain-containing protein n=1 Tax=Chroococcidiopsis cubana SAG 39.79 TaxID=388085 RepID=A0AB37UAV6_9CYAN|nr:hypothetical protein [Chroococcidiopsis cubana]MDZ4871048.1 hypothetical protein [Chroococcidiopsis cubana SAG 39.79]PSB65583.1 hypothetical protein C7B79_04795 [Chroococcidiopsis cubana CCALA 043]RUT02337.1 hypothetical protein DSM107010_62770 [Chroococcidiopsis cubana SAG 39.79]
MTDQNLYATSIVADSGASLSLINYINTSMSTPASEAWFAVGDLVDVVLSGDAAEALRGHIGYCQRCGCEDVTVKIGKPPHAYSLNCSNCEKWIKWLNKRAIVLVGGAV